MKKPIVVTAVVVVLICSAAILVRAQEKPSSPYEYALLKWDGPDRLYYNLPGKFEMVHLEKQGTKIPAGAQPEEFCLAVGCNQLARDGWEPVNLDSRRILLRRPARR